MFTDVGNSCITHAHRGARGYAPENTMPAFKKAHELGAEVIELDVNLTKDGHVVVFHDFVLKRTSNISVHPELQKKGEKTGVHNLTLKELRTLDAGKWYAEVDPFGQITNDNVSKKEVEAFTGTVIPTLEEVLVFIKESGMLLNLEIKDQTKIGNDDQTLVYKVLELITQYDVKAQTMISSFNHNYLRTIQKEMPDMPLGVLVEERLENPVEYCKKLGAVAYHPSRRFTTADDIKRLREAGLMVNIWTINSEHELHVFADWGANGLISDFPDLAKAAAKDSAAS